MSLVRGHQFYKLDTPLTLHRIPPWLCSPSTSRWTSKRFSRTRWLSQMLADCTICCNIFQVFGTLRPTSTPSIFVQYSSICKGTVYSTRCKFISYLHNVVDCAAWKVTYTRTFWDQFSNSFNTYLAVLRNIHLQVDKALGCDTPDWRLWHNCPPCSNKVGWISIVHNMTNFQ